MRNRITITRPEEATGDRLVTSLRLFGKERQNSGYPKPLRLEKRTVSTLHMLLRTTALQGTSLADQITELTSNNQDGANETSYGFFQLQMD